MSRGSFDEIAICVSEKTAMGVPFWLTCSTADTGNGKKCFQYDIYTFRTYSVVLN